jgi:hypothetical protein
LNECSEINYCYTLQDFIITVIFGVLWLSSSAAWANGLSGLKSATEPIVKPDCNCNITTSNFSTLNISVVSETC